MTKQAPVPSLTPIGKLGLRGRRATPEERSKVMDALFFEGERRTRYLQQYFVLMLLSATIAAFGLTNDSAAVVIGAMLVAPLMTPILAIAAALVQGWAKRAVDSLLVVGGGALTAIAVGMVVGLLVPTLHTGMPLPGELLARTGPNLIDLGIALAAGAAAGFVAARTDASGALPGVGIAVALVPPLATVGITLGLGEWGLAFGALLLFVTNLVAIIIAAGLVLVAAGFAAFRDPESGRGASRGTRLVWFGLLLVIIPLGYHSWVRYLESSTLVEVVRDARGWAPALTVQDVRIDRSTDPISVTVTVTGASDLPDPNVLAGLVAEDLRSAVDLDIVFVPVVGGSAPAP